VYVFKKRKGNPHVCPGTVAFPKDNMYPGRKGKGKGKGREGKGMGNNKLAQLSH